MLNWHGFQFGALVNSNVCFYLLFEIQGFLVTDRFQQVCDIFFRQPYNALKSHFDRPNRSPNSCRCYGQVRDSWGDRGGFFRTRVPRHSEVRRIPGGAQAHPKDGSHRPRVGQPQIRVQDTDVTLASQYCQVIIVSVISYQVRVCPTIKVVFWF